MHFRTPYLSVLLFATLLHAADEPIEPPPQKQDPTVPERGYFREYPNAWDNFHKLYLGRAKQGGINVLMLGDSLTYGWSEQKELWKKSFEPLKAANFGIGGDRTQQILWRITNGEIDGITPKVIVLMIGLNNIWFDDAPDKIEAGIRNITNITRQKLPGTKILLLGLLPAFRSASDPVRARIKKVNEMIAGLDDKTTVRFLDMGLKFIEADGSIADAKEFYQPDYVHLKPKGYQLWADTMLPLLTEMLK